MNSGPVWCRQLVKPTATPSQQSPHGSKLSLNVFTVSIYDPPLLHFQPSQLLNFDFKEGPYLDRAFHSDAFSNPDSATQKDADPDLQYCLFSHVSAPLFSNDQRQIPRTVRLRGPGRKSLRNLTENHVFVVYKGRFSSAVSHTKTTFDLF